MHRSSLLAIHTTAGSMQQQPAAECDPYLQKPRRYSFYGGHRLNSEPIQIQPQHARFNLEPGLYARYICGGMAKVIAPSPRQEINGSGFIKSLSTGEETENGKV